MTQVSANLSQCSKFIFIPSCSFTMLYNRSNIIPLNSVEHISGIWIGIWIIFSKYSSPLPSWIFSNAFTTISLSNTNKYIILGNFATDVINWKTCLICSLLSLSISSITTRILLFWPFNSWTTFSFWHIISFLSKLFCIRLPIPLEILFPKKDIAPPTCGITFAKSNASEYRSKALPTSFNVLSFVQWNWFAKWTKNCSNNWFVLEKFQGSKRTITTFSFSFISSRIIFTSDVFPVPHCPYSPIVKVSWLFKFSKDLATSSAKYFLFKKSSFLLKIGLSE